MQKNLLKSFAKTNRLSSTIEQLQRLLHAGHQVRVSGQPAGDKKRAERRRKKLAGEKRHFRKKVIFLNFRFMLIFPYSGVGIFQLWSAVNLEFGPWKKVAGGMAKSTHETSCSDQKNQVW